MLLLRSDLVDNQGVGGLFTPVGRDVIGFDAEECICSLDALSFSLYIPSFPLEQATHLIGVGRDPGGCIIGVLA